MKIYCILFIFSLSPGIGATFHYSVKVADATYPQPVPPFVRIGSGNYLISSSADTWIGATQACHRQGADLANIESEREWRAINNYLVSKGVHSSVRFWLGGNDIDKAFEFFWLSSGQPMKYTKWSAHQPDNTRNVERCVHLWRIGNKYLMNDWMCNQQIFYICKAKTPKVVTTTVW